MSLHTSLIALMSGLACALLGSGCASAEGGASEQDRAAVAESIEVTCDRRRDCCGEAGFDLALLDDCEAQLDSPGNFAASVRAGRIQLREPAFSECVDAYRSSDPCSLSRPESCGDTVEGVVDQGGTCGTAGDCVREDTPVVCVKRSDRGDGVLGVCDTFVRAGIGEPCVVTARTGTYGVTFTFLSKPPNLGYCAVQDGLSCDQSTQTCQQFLAEGAVCNTPLGTLCELDLYCDGTCMRSKTEGESCDETRECELGLACKEHVCVIRTLVDSPICQGKLLELQPL